MNRIQALERDIRRHSARLGNRSSLPVPKAAPGPAPQPKPAAPTTPAQEATASALSAWRGSRPRGSAPHAARRVRAMSTIDYRVPDLPMPIQQTSTMVCWAFVATMMASWRDRASWSVEAYVASLGGPWAGKLAANSGLSAAEAPVLLATMGVQIETTQANFTNERWESMLRDWGPIWVTADNNPAIGIQGVHAHILVGIHGPSDGDPTVDVIDPGLGREVSMPMSQFVAKYEQLANTPFAGLQIRHWPARAQQAAQLSRSWALQALERSRQMSPAAVGAAVAAGGLLFDIMKEVATTPSGLTWNKSSLKGMTIPGNIPEKKALAEKQPYHSKGFLSKKRIVWDYYVVEDNVGAEFEVTYEYNGNSVANVLINNKSYAPPAPLTGHVLQVDTDITQSYAHERNDVCAVLVTITYHFSYARGSAGTYTQRYVLYGDGRAEEFTETRG